MKSFFSYSLFITILYFFIYDPPFAFLGGIRWSYIFIVLSLVYIILRYREWNSYYKLFRTEMLLFSIVVCYSFVRSGIMGDYMYIVRHLLSLLYIITVVPIILIISKKMGINTESKIIKVILVTSSIAGCISILCLLVPSFDEYVRNNLIQYEEEDYLFGNLNRGFGIANGLTSSYGYIQGTIVVLGLKYYKENKWFIYFMPVVFFSALINARTGVLMTFWGGVVLVVSKNKNAFIPVLALAIGFMYYLKEIMSFAGFNDYTIAWILDFQNQIGNLSTGDFSGGAATNLFKIVLPTDAFEWLLGRGIDLFSIKIGYEHSDMGWLIQLNYGGILYVVLLYYVLFVYMPKRLINYRQFSLALFIIGVMIICNTKSKIFPSLSFFPLLILLYYVVISKMQPYVTWIAESKKVNTKEH